MIKVICKTYWEKKLNCKKPCTLIFPKKNETKARELLKEIIKLCQHKPKFERK